MPISNVIYHSLFLLGLYSETENKYCRTNGGNEISLDGDYSQLDTAQATCMGDDTCFGVFDLCGDGKNFQLCNASMSIAQSGCGSILYKRKGRLPGTLKVPPILIIVHNDTIYSRYLHTS